MGCENGSFGNGARATKINKMRSFVKGSRSEQKLRNCDDRCTVVVVILLAPKRCFRQCEFLLPAAFQAANTSVTLVALARKGKVFGTSHVISDHFMLACVVTASSDMLGKVPRRCFGVQLKQYGVTLKLRLQDAEVRND